MISTKKVKTIFNKKKSIVCCQSKGTSSTSIHNYRNKYIYRLKNIFLTNQFDLIYHNNVIDLNYNRKRTKYQKTNHHLEEVHQEHKA